MDYAPPFRILSTCRGGGYRYCRTDPPHPKANAKGLYPLHRVIVENRLGRLLGPDELVHHADGDKTNDDPANLHLIGRAEHSRHHARTVDPVDCTCAICGADFALTPAQWRRRLKQRPSGEVACSRRCGAILGHRPKAA